MESTDVESDARPVVDVHVELPPEPESEPIVEPEPEPEPEPSTHPAVEAIHHSETTAMLRELGNKHDQTNSHLSRIADLLASEPEEEPEPEVVVEAPEAPPPEEEPEPEREPTWLEKVFLGR